jgi:hypothetical protein
MQWKSRPNCLRWAIPFLFIFVSTMPIGCGPGSQILNVPGLTGAVGNVAQMLIPLLNDPVLGPFLQKTIFGQDDLSDLTSQELWVKAESLMTMAQVKRYAELVQKYGRAYVFNEMGRAIKAGEINNDLDFMNHDFTPRPPNGGPEPPTAPPQPGGSNGDGPPPPDPEDPPPPIISEWADDVSLSEVIFMEPPNAGDWEVVSDLRVNISGNLISYQWDAPWGQHIFTDKGHQIAGNVWIGTKQSGKWKLCPWEWYTVGQNGNRSMSKAAFNVPGHICHGMDARYPQPGEEVLFMASTCARVGKWMEDGRHQRTRIVKMNWR